MLTYFNFGNGFIGGRKVHLEWTKRAGIPFKIWILRVRFLSILVAAIDAIQHTFKEDQDWKVVIWIK